MMNVQREPLPHSIEVILGLTGTIDKTTQSFRPYLRRDGKERNSKIHENTENTCTRLVPRQGQASLSLCETTDIISRAFDARRENMNFSSHTRCPDEKAIASDEDNCCGKATMNFENRTYSGIVCMLVTTASTAWWVYFSRYLYIKNAMLCFV